MRAAAWRAVATAELDLPAPYALEETLFSGQAFRWRRGGGFLEGYIGNAPVRLRAANGAVTAEGATDGDLEALVARHLRVGDPLPSIYRSISKDPHIRAAVRRWRGLHVLAQDPWETTISFIASSASNVPKISRSIEKMCRLFGEEVAYDGESWHLFPTPERLARADLSALRSCEFGYRCAYIRSTARKVAEGEIDLRAIARTPTEQAQGALVAELDGIGPKVAACILLFSMGKDDAFPVDRHVQRAVSEWYFGGAKLSAKPCESWGRAYFGRWAGYAQQYLFHDRRSRRRTRAA